MWVRYLVFVVLVVVIAAIVIGVQRAQRRLAGDPGTDDAVTARHAEAISAARKQLKRAQRDHRKAVRRAEKALTKAGEDKPIVSVGPVVLRPLSITLRGTDHPLTERTTFELEVTGEVTSHLKDGRVVQDDQREVYLTVTDPGWGDVIKLRPAQIEGARRLIVAGEAAVRTLGRARDERDARVSEAQAELDRVRADTGPVDLAQLTLEDLEGAPPRPLDLGQARPGPLPPGDAGPGSSPAGDDDDLGSPRPGDDDDPGPGGRHGG